MTKRTIPVAVLIASSGVALGCLSSRTGPSDNVAGRCDVPLTAAFPGSTVVVIRNFGFSPAEVQVAAGGKVTWINCDVAGQPAHTSTGDQGQWDTGSLLPGESRTEIFVQAGRFDYHCEPHPFMKGAVVVEP